MLIVQRYSTGFFRLTVKMWCWSLAGQEPSCGHGQQFEENHRFLFIYLVFKPSFAVLFGGVWRLPSLLPCTFFFFFPLLDPHLHILMGKEEGVCVCMAVRACVCVRVCVLGGGG